PRAGRLLRRRARLRWTVQPGLDEAILQELLRVEERERPGARAEDDHDELLPVAPRRHGQVVAGLESEPGLERLHTQRVVEQRNVARVDAPAVDERLPAQHRPRSGMVSEQPGDELGEVAGVATLGRLGEPGAMRGVR